MGDLTERYGLERDEEFRLSEYPTLEALASYLAERRAGGAPAPAAPAVAASTDEPTEPVPHAPAAPEPAPVAHASEDTLNQLLGVVADKTGYDLEDLDPTFELEADLGR